MAKPVRVIHPRRRSPSFYTMRLLHVTDFHFRQTWFHWLAAQSPNYDACCLTGGKVGSVCEEGS